MTTDQPTAFIKHQSLTVTPIAGDATLVDDPVALVDDLVALVGGPVAISEGLQTKATPTVPRLVIKINR